MRSLRSLPRRGLVIAPETYRRSMDCPSQRCNGIVTERRAPPGDNSACLQDCATACGDALEVRLNPGAQLLRQRGVTELRGFRLALALRPPDELHQRPRLRRVAVALVHQQPGEARGWIRPRARRVGDRNPEVGIRAHL